MPRFIPPQHLFRNPHNLLPFLSSCANYAVYFISAHGELIGTFDSADVDSETAFAVVQTGGGESIGCRFRAGGEAVMMDLFSKNIVYSFQQLLGLYGDRISPFYRDLHYATSDEQTVEDEYRYEDFPNKLLSYDKDDLVKINAGVFCYDPVAKDVPAGTPAFQRLPEFDEIFDPVKTGGGISLLELLNLFPKKIAELSSTNPYYRPLVGRIPIYVISSCATVVRGLSNTELNALVRVSAATSHYSIIKPEEPTEFPRARMINPESYSYYITGKSKKVPTGWRGTKRGKRIHKKLFGVEMPRNTKKQKNRQNRIIIRNMLAATGATLRGAATGGGAFNANLAAFRKLYGPNMLPPYESPNRGLPHNTKPSNMPDTP